MKFTKNCSRCGSTNTERSRRKRLERLLLGFRPFRCNECHCRFLSFVGPHQSRMS